MVGLVKHQEADLGQLWGLGVCAQAATVAHTVIGGHQEAAAAAAPLADNTWQGRLLHVATSARFDGHCAWGHWGCSIKATRCSVVAR